MAGKQWYLDMFEEGINAIHRHVRQSASKARGLEWATKAEGWYVDVDMRNGGVMFPFARCLQAFWPGLLSLWGDLDEASALFQRFFTIHE